MGSICSSNSENNLFHRYNCKYVKMIPKKNRIVFDTAKDARDQGRKYCKCCSAIMVMYRQEKDEIDKYGKEHGIYLSFDRDDGSLNVISRTGKWKLVYNSKRDMAFLYHKNRSDHNHYSKDLIKGYHYQSAYSESLLGYMEYIYEHDAFRKEQPLYDSHKNKLAHGKGGKNRRNLERALRREQSIRYVNYLLEGKASGALVL